MKKFKCKKCPEEKRIWMGRHGFRKHIREEHFIKHGLMRFDLSKKGRVNQPWLIEEEFK